MKPFKTPTNPPKLADEADRPLELQLTGSFSIEAAAGDDGQNRNRRFATEETARNTKRLLDEFRRGGASFA